MAESRLSVKLSVSKEVRRQLRVLAAHEDKTISDLLRDALEEYFKKRGVAVDLKDGLDTWGGAGRKEKSD